MSRLTSATRRRSIVGAASGGVWKTINAGTTWTPLFDREGVASIGDVALSASNPDLVWVGTGEPNNRQSSSFGDGVYKSLDGGRSWSAHGAARDAAHRPRDHRSRRFRDGLRGRARTVVGAERRARRLQDHRRRPLVDQRQVHRSGHRRRRHGDGSATTATCCMRPRISAGGRRGAFSGGGPGGGIYKTADGGRTWTKLTRGLPDGIIGRIGLAIWRKDPRVLYATVEHREGGGTFRSDDGGDTWRKMSAVNPRPMYYSKIHIDPTNDRRIYILGASLFVSDDGGRTFADPATGRPGANEVMSPTYDVGVHGDHHALWINPANPQAPDPRQRRRAVLLVRRAASPGTRSTTSRSGSSTASASTWRRRTTSTAACRTPIRSAVRARRGTTSASSTTTGCRSTPATACTRRSIPTIPTRSTPSRRTATCRASIGRPAIASRSVRRRRPARAPYRFNWTSPLVDLAARFEDAVLRRQPRVPLDRSRRHLDGRPGHHARGGSQHLLDHGHEAGPRHVVAKRRRERVGRDHDAGRIAGAGRRCCGRAPTMASCRCRATAARPGRNVTDRMPGPARKGRISRVEPSTAMRAPSTSRSIATRTTTSRRTCSCRATSARPGRRWPAACRPSGWINVVKEHPKNPAVLFAGTETGLFVSLNSGGDWTRFTHGFPTVPVDDLVIHPRDNDLVVATHGRAIYVLDDVSPLSGMTAEVAASELHLFPPRAATILQRWKHESYSAQRVFAGPNPPVGRDPDVSRQDAGEGPRGTSRSAMRPAPSMRELEGTTRPGFNRVVWDLRSAAPALLTGAARTARAAGYVCRDGARRRPRVDSHGHRRSRSRISADRRRAARRASRT